jgi:hypothetical protein
MWVAADEDSKSEVVAELLKATVDGKEAEPDQTSQARASPPLPDVELP